MNTSIRWYQLANWINSNKATRIAEVGTSAGWTSRELLRTCSGLKFYLLIDWDGRDFPFAELISQYHMKTKFVKLYSHEASRIVDDESLDLVFIDADHSYESTKEDIELWFPKIRKGGMLCGHDYENPDWPGVKQAVDEIFPNAKITPEGTGSMWWREK